MPQLQREEIVSLAIEIALKVGLLFLLFYVAFLITKPFLGIILWGIILAVAFSPVIDKFENFVGGRKKLIIIMAMLAALALVLPTWMLSDQIIDSSKSILSALHEHKNLIPEPTQRVKAWPVIGEKSYELWESAYNNFEETLKNYTPEIKVLLQKAAGVIKGVLGVIVMTIASLVVAAALLIAKEDATAFYYRAMERLLGKRGKEWGDLSILTVRSVANGVVGVAVIQAVLAMVGMLFMHVPLAPLWAVMVMFLTIIQLPALIVIGPVIAYVFSYADGAGASVFAVYMLIVGGIDGVLKPLLMARGVDIPMLVILIGAIGGMILMGMIGLFLGAVIFALAYKLFMVWLDEVGARSASLQER